MLVQTAIASLLNMTTTSAGYSTTSSNLTTERNYMTTVAPILTEKQKNLMWVLPTVLGILFFLGIVACIVFYTIKSCEIFTIRMCYRFFGCCAPTAKNTQYSELRDPKEDDSDTLYLRDLRERAFDPDKYLDDKYQ